MAEGGGGQRLYAIFIGDSSSYVKATMNMIGPTRTVSMEIKGVGHSAAEGARALDTISGGFEDGARTARSYGNSVSELASALGTVASIGQEVVSIATTKAVWDIRLLQYTNQQFIAEQRIERLDRELIRDQQNMIKLDQQGNQLTEKTITIWNKYYESQLQVTKGFDDLRISTGNALIATGRFGAQSLEAREATQEWEQEFATWGEKAYALGAPIEKIMEVHKELASAIESGVLPDFQKIGESVGWQTDKWGALGTQGLSVTDILNSGQQSVQGEIENTITYQHQLTKAVADYSSEVAIADKTLEESNAKVNEAQQEQQLMWINIGMGILDVASKILFLGNIVSGGSLFGAGAGGGLAAGTTAGGEVTGGVLGGLEGALSGIGSTIAGGATAALNLPFTAAEAVGMPGMGTTAEEFISGIMGETTQVAEAAIPTVAAAGPAAAGGITLGTLAEVLPPIALALVGASLTKLLITEPETEREAQKVGLPEDVYKEKVLGPLGSTGFGGIGIPFGQTGIRDIPETGPIYAHQHEQLLSKPEKEVYERILSENTGTKGAPEAPETGIVTPTAIAALGSYTEGKAEAGPVHISIGDINIYPQQFSKKEDMRAFALDLRRYLQVEMARAQP